jgi:chemotaxis protein CheC
MSGMLRLTELQIDALKEIANIGAGHAATALSQLLDSTIKLEAPTADVVSFDELDSRVDNDVQFAVLHVYVRGDVPGHLIVLLDRYAALEFVGTYLERRAGDVKNTDAALEPTLTEFANIVAASYLGALVQLTGANLVPSVPAISYGTMQTAFEGLSPAVPYRDVIFVESTFLDRGARIYGHVIFLPDAGSVEPFLAAFGV